MTAQNSVKVFDSTFFDRSAEDVAFDLIGPSFTLARR
jgi:hypothetical protein